MARTTLTPIPMPTRYAFAAVAVTYTALDAVDGGQWTMTGDDILLVRNTGGTGRTVTLKSTPDSSGRTGDMSLLVPATTGIACFGRPPLTGWQQSDGRAYIDVTGAGIEAAVLRLPPG